MKKIVFMGTPDFAVKSLQALLDQADYQLVAVVTQPDRPVGRKRRLTPSPVKELAQAHDLKIFQPENIGQDQEVADFFAQEEVDLLVTAAYGQFLPQSLLQAPKYGAVNVHASLLPKYRGGAPIHYAIWKGDKETGVSLMRMVPAMDAGPILAQAKAPIDDQVTVAEMFDRLGDLGAELLVAKLPELFAGTLEAVDQDESQASYAPNIKKAEERIDWKEPAQAIHNKIRAFNSWPGAYALYEDQRWKFWRTEVLAGETTDKAPGTVVRIQKKPAQFVIAAGDGQLLNVLEIQPNGKKAMAIASFINGGAGQIDVNDRFE
ncbi:MULTISPECIES: methionyl-tRNA formyltransferase [Aerococcus]|uniref:Methionyl-tRNA formyltransferase n=1 Tax=Aerococcus sanguinicola TaxID=119206 RepID=A0A5N1GIM5_9LACT|nr:MULTISPECIES: methionyl-tRNA formyltransferase [Aerococcus]KAA9300793.1 methionyl-tRNA formyltransferase [Aerococcus sanguinicola]MDK6369421.1 methionyl-tRNA formyltransferase [Aerococcus sp. UMB9870]MDK6680484.1 methionyl-tRNA formyltransferase [Aerococcus sp. UMB8608]MDK6686716.1 methionyl-tRNA formyltransferase [Aerococcus sp. UMB8623]MDK6940431.1 methionyl-tRNA formyltransferase [Aerococcus sp. UMB8487]